MMISTQRKNISNKSLVVFRHFNVELLGLSLRIYWLRVTGQKDLNEVGYLEACLRKVELLIEKFDFLSSDLAFQHTVPAPVLSYIAVKYINQCALHV